MDDLISRQVAIDEINHICPIDTEYDCTLLDRVDVRCVLLNLPSADAVEVVRCRNCKHYDSTMKACFSGLHAILREPNWFCADAERKKVG